jgi:hypothetical protein
MARQISRQFGVISMTMVLRVVGILILCLAGIGAQMQRDNKFDPPPSLPGSFRSPILVMELVRTAENVRSVLRDPMGQHNRDLVRRQIELDWAFIPAYWICFTGLGLIALACPWPGARVIGALVIFTAEAAALCDVFENQGILLILDTPPAHLNDSMATAIRHPSLAKWGFLAVVEAGLATLFLAYGRREFLPKVLTKIAGWAFGIAAVLGLFGVAIPTVADFLGRDWDPAAIEWSSVSMAVGLLAAAPVLLFFPGRFLSGIGVKGPWELAD